MNNEQDDRKQDAVPDKKTTRRDFIKKSAKIGLGAGVGLTMMDSILMAGKDQEKEAPEVGSKKKVVRWRLQSYAGPALNEHVVQKAIDKFNEVADGEMVIDVYTADALVPHGELFRAVQEGTIDAAVSDDDSMQSPVDVSVFGAYFPLATRYFLDVPVLWEWYGIDKIFEEAYAEVKNVTWLSTGAWDPCNFASRTPIRSVKDFEGMRMYMFPTIGKFMQRFGVIPQVLPYEDVEMAIQTGVLDGVAWSGITEDYTVGWADVCDYYLTNPVSGAWAGSWIVNTESWEKLSPRAQALYRLAINDSHYYRLHWYWWGEAHYRTQGEKMALTTIPSNDWKQIEQEALNFWDEIAQVSDRTARVVKILKDYQKIMEQAGPPYRYA
jgi:TRAP-type mannitol/chloroaromatic compound transport system substrate-binding protein